MEKAVHAALAVKDAARFVELTVRNQDMTTTQLEKLLFAQGGKCFFCKNKLNRNEASVEHLVAKANGGSNDINDNCVACCKAVNSLMGNLPLKHKIEIILNQEGKFLCPVAPVVKTPQPTATAKVTPKEDENFNLAVTDLKKRGNARPKKLKTLASTISAIPKLKGLNESQISAVIKKLEAQGKIVITGEKVSYKL